MAIIMISAVLRDMLERSLCCSYHELNIMLAARGGINTTYCVVVGKQRFFARDGNPTVHHIEVDRRNEVVNTIMAFRSGIGPRVVAFDVNSHCLITEGLPGEHPSIELASSKNHLESIGKTIAQLHRGSDFMGELRPLDLSEQKYVELKQNGIRFPEKLDRLMSNIEVLRHCTVNNERELRPSHNDLGVNNMLDWADRHYFVDFECSGMAGFLYDISKYARHLRLNKEMVEILVRAYQPMATDELIRETEHVMIVSAIWMTMRLYVQIGIGNNVERNEKRIPGYLERLFKLVDIINPSLVL